MSSVDDENREPPPRFDPGSAAYNADPYPLLTWARAHSPFYAEDYDCWVVSRYSDIEAALRDWETFSNATLGPTAVPAEFRHRVPEAFFAQSFNALDPPDHTPVRKLGQKGFSRTSMKAMEGSLRNMANRLIDEFIDDTSCELISQYCHRLSHLAIAELLDLPEEQLPRMMQLADDLPRVFADHISPMPSEERTERWERVAALREDLKHLIAERRSSPGEDLISTLIIATDADGSPLLTDERIVTHVTEFIFAGTDTTANLVAAIVMLLDAHPDQRDAVQSDPRLMEQAVEEALRRRGTVIGVFRITRRPIDIGGVAIPEGARVYLALASAGHDETRFPAPQTFDLARPNSSDHLAFGKGRHMCMGAPLARVEAAIALDTLYERIPNLRVTAGQQLRYGAVLLSVMLEQLLVEW